MVETDFAELVDHHGGVGERRIFQKAVAEAGLAGAEEAGGHRQRKRRAGSPGRWSRGGYRRAAHCADGVAATGFGLGFGLGFAAGSAAVAGFAGAALASPVAALV